LGALLIDLDIPKFKLNVDLLTWLHLVFYLHCLLEFTYWKVVLQYCLPLHVSNFKNLLNQLWGLLNLDIAFPQLFYQWRYF
jgi:hypothetical protein